MGRTTERLIISEEDRLILESWIRTRTMPHRVVFRAQICLFLADGMSVAEISEKLGTSRPTILLWRKRFEEGGTEALLRDAPRGPNPRKLNDDVTKLIVDTTLNTYPPDSDHWTTRSLGKVLGLSNATIARVWKSQGIRTKTKKQKPQKSKSDSKNNAELVAVYLDPPIRAMVVATGMQSNTTFQTLSEGWMLDSDYNNGCSKCLFASFDLVSYLKPIVVDDSLLFHRFDGFLRKLESDISKERRLFLILDRSGYNGSFGNYVGMFGRFSTHLYPLDFTREESIRKLIGTITGFPLMPESSGNVHHFISQITRRMTETSSNPWIWMPNGDDEQVSGTCLAVLNSIKNIGNILQNSVQKTSASEPGALASKEITMKWMEKLENWFSATAFAEAGEHETAMQMVGIDPNEKTATAPSISRIFAASAFAEANEHAMAIDILEDRKRALSFLETVGLQGVRVRYATFSAEPTFLEAAGLLGVKHRLVTISL